MCYKINVIHTTRLKTCKKQEKTKDVKVGFKADNKVQFMISMIRDVPGIITTLCVYRGLSWTIEVVFIKRI